MWPPVDDGMTVAAQRTQVVLGVEFVLPAICARRNRHAVVDDDESGSDLSVSVGESESADPATVAPGFDAVLARFRVALVPVHGDPCFRSLEHEGVVRAVVSARGWGSRIPSCELVLRAFRSTARATLQASLRSLSLGIEAERRGRGSALLERVQAAIDGGGSLGDAIEAEE